MDLSPPSTPSFSPLLYDSLEIPRLRASPGAKKSQMLKAFASKISDGVEAAARKLPDNDDVLSDLTATSRILNLDGGGRALSKLPENPANALLRAAAAESVENMARLREENDDLRRRLLLAEKRLKNGRRDKNYEGKNVENLLMKSEALAEKVRKYKGISKEQEVLISELRAEIERLKGLQASGTSTEVSETKNLTEDDTEALLSGKSYVKRAELPKNEKKNETIPVPEPEKVQKEPKETGSMDKVTSYLQRIVSLLENEVGNVSKEEEEKAEEVQPSSPKVEQEEPQEQENLPSEPQNLKNNLEEPLISKIAELCDKLEVFITTASKPNKAQEKTSEEHSEKPSSLKDFESSKSQNTTLLGSEEPHISESNTTLDRILTKIIRKKQLETELGTLTKDTSLLEYESLLKPVNLSREFEDIEVVKKGDFLFGLKSRDLPKTGTSKPAYSRSDLDTLQALFDKSDENWSADQTNLGSAGLDDVIDSLRNEYHEISAQVQKLASVARELDPLAEYKSGARRSELMARLVEKMEEKRDLLYRLGKGVHGEKESREPQQLDERLVW